MGALANYNSDEEILFKSERSVKNQIIVSFYLELIESLFEFIPLPNDEWT